MDIVSCEGEVCVSAGCMHFASSVKSPPFPVFLQRLGFLSMLTCLLGVCDLPSLGDRDWRRSGDSQSAWVPRSSELQRETSGERRCFRSFDRPRSLPPERWVSDLWPMRDEKAVNHNSTHPGCWTILTVWDRASQGPWLLQACQQVIWKGGRKGWKINFLWRGKCASCHWKDLQIQGCNCSLLLLFVLDIIKVESLPAAWPKNPLNFLGGKWH